MMKKFFTSYCVISLSVAVAVILFFCITDSVSNAAPYSRARLLMGTLIEITVETEDRANAEAAIDRAFEEMSRIDSSMSSYKKNSEVSLISRQAGKSLVQISSTLVEVLKASIQYHSESHGAFDVTAGPLIRLWGFIGGKKRIPSKEEINDALSRVGSEKIVLDTAKGAVSLPIRGMEIDLGGIAKGYAADRAAKALQIATIKSGIVNAGGDLLVFGYPGCNGIRIGIRHPVNNEELLGWIEVGEGAVATSGSYENFFEHNGRLYSHIIDPRTGHPIEGMLSVTVRASTAMEADALATALFVLGPEEGIKLAGRLKNIEALLAYNEGKGTGLITIATPGFGLNVPTASLKSCYP